MNTEVATTLEEGEILLLGEHVRRLLVTMSFDNATIRSQHLPPYLYIHIEAGPEGNLLIGTHGAHLAALQHLLRTILRDTVPVGTRLIVDVNGYRARREQELLQVAEAAARRAVTQGQTVILPPMNSADRRAIHTALAKREDVATESTGVEPQRSVVVKPVFL